MARQALSRRQAASALQRDDIQGILLDPYDSLPSACFLLLRITEPPEARQWLRSLPVTSTEVYRRNPGASAVNVAITWPGLQVLRGREEAVLYATREFREGMATDHRSRFLGDLADSAPETWRWRGDEGSGIEPGAAVHLLLMIYAADPASLAELVDLLAGRPERDGLRLIETIETVRLAGSREHFGFRDGIGQPLVQGDAEGKVGDRLIAAGEFVLGYRNGFGGYSLSPAVPASEDPLGVFSQSPVDPNARDLGRNGSYLVFRQLSQDVRAFWSFVDRAVSTEHGAESGSTVALAAKMVGRWPSGASLLQYPERDPGKPAADDSFGYAEADPHGHLVPLGSHVRRANPRDALVDNVRESQTVVGHHRILRRARAYGPPLDPSMNPAAMLAAADDGAERGLNFICFNADIGRQFQFVQHDWMNSPKFGGLYDDASPLLGDREPSNEAVAFTVQGAPVRRRYPGIERFVRVRGGAYFFLPGLKAVEFLAGAAP